MRVTVLCTLPTDHTSTRRWLPEALAALGHDVELVDRPDLPAAQAATLGYRLVDSWPGGAPDAVLAAGWVAGVAALVATRERPSPVLLRLPRVGRSGDAAVTRVERALVRSGATALAASPSEAEALAVLGAARASTRVVPEAILSPSGESEPAGMPPDVVVATDDTAEAVTAVLSGMAAGRPAVVLDRGVLADLVVDRVTGLVLPPLGDLDSAVAGLRADSMRREAMGMAAADRVQACFAIDAVAPILGRVLDEVTSSALTAA